MRKSFISTSKDEPKVTDLLSPLVDEDNKESAGDVQLAAVHFGEKAVEHGPEKDEAENF